MASSTAGHNLTISDEDRGPGVIAVAAVVTSISTIVISLRTWSRFQRKVTVWLDDIVLIISFVFLWMQFAMIAWAKFYGGLGRPLLVNYLTDPEIITPYLKIVFALGIVTPVCVTLTKTSVLLMYCRLFQTPFIRRACIGIGVFSVCWCVAAVFPNIFRCAPISKAWQPLNPEGSCGERVGRWIGAEDGIPEVITNFVIWLLPIYEISRLATTLRKKIAISAVFGLASLSVVAGIVRLTLAFQLYDKITVDSETTTAGNGDVTLEMAPVLMWTQLEVCSGFIAACLPALRPLIVKFLEKVRIISTRDSEKEAKPQSGQELVTIGQLRNRGGARFLGAFRSSKGLQCDEELLAATVVDGQSSETLGQGQHRGLTFHPEGYEAERQCPVKGNLPGDSDSSDRRIIVRTEVVWQEDQVAHNGMMQRQPRSS